MSVTDQAVRKPTTAPARSRAATRERLLRAGTELFARGGLHGATSARIARRAGVATGTFYLHFPDKEALFREIVFGALEELRARVRAAVRRAGDGGEAGVRARAAELLAFAEENQNLIRVLFGRDAESDLGEDVLEDVIPGVEQALRRRARAGEGARGVHPSVAAQALVAMWTRVIRWWVDHPEHAPREEVIETMTRLHPAVGRGDDGEAARSSHPQETR